MRTDELLCRLGLHHIVWAPDIAGEFAWLLERRCARCGRLIPTRMRP